jgi:hypothetical protein
MYTLLIKNCLKFKIKMFGGPGISHNTVLTYYSQSFSDMKSGKFLIFLTVQLQECPIPRGNRGRAFLGLEGISADFPYSLKA